VAIECISNAPLDLIKGCRRFGKKRLEIHLAPLDHDVGRLRLLDESGLGPESWRGFG
jgi:hypothetical protein